MCVVGGGGELEEAKVDAFPLHLTASPKKTHVLSTRSRVGIARETLV